MRQIAVLIFATILLVVANAIFEQPPTEHLTDQNFQGKVLNSSDPWIVAVYWNPCKHSKRYSKEVWPEIISIFNNSNVRWSPSIATLSKKRTIL
ncbi:unnamed protein product, partial [Mesorhabditis belari]|uniref:Thioredoxin domain-containing protein n=1 Tax=Mesorhabditis belari TaxID=2138241 RepID=A0AAF3EBN2_9BILA